MDNSFQEVRSRGIEVENNTPLKTLLVEDDKSVVLLIKRVLNGHNVTSFESAEEALDELRKSKEAGISFDWVITDNGLAGKMDGFGLADAIKSRRFGNPFVTMLTASAVSIQKENSQDQLEKKGINQLIGKPFNVQALSNSVNTVRDFIKQSQNPQE